MPRNKNKSGKKEKGADVVKSVYGKPLKEKITTLNGNLFGFPDRLRVKLRWNEKYQSNSSSGALTTQVFRGNSLFDPDFTGIFSATPAFFETLAGVYGQYVVLGAKISILGQVLTVEGMEVALWASDVNLNTLSMQQVSESKRVKNLSYGGTSSNANPYPKPLTMAVSSSEMQGQKEIESDNSNYTVVTANPSDVWYFGYHIQSGDAATTSTINLRVTIDFDCVFKELKSWAT